LWGNAYFFEGVLKVEKQKTTLDDRLYQYMLCVSLRENKVLKALREETATGPMSVLQISADQGQFMALVVKLTGARRILEIGTFTGYSALAMALALPEDGRLFTLDVNKEWTDTAIRYWRQAGVHKKIELHLAPALATMEGFLSQGQGESFDLIFIDADKLNYPHYYEFGMRLLKPGGLILVDNVFWRGKIIDESVQDEETRTLRKLNARIHADDRVEISMIQIGDGMTLARKIP
jgi:caffeoyl-CoA O-methyltransferase